MACGRSLIEARDELRAALLAGQIVDCPCCRQRCKVYKRKLNRAMARSLIWLVGESQKASRWNLDSKGWVNVPLIAPHWVLRSRELPKLIHWSLVEECPKDPEDTKRRTSGIWRPTSKGIAFARGEIEVLSHVHLYNNMVYDVGHTERIGVQEACGEEFDYEELMRALPVLQ